MSSNFKKQAAQQRAAIPQIDPEAAKPAISPAATPKTTEMPETTAIEPEQSTQVPTSVRLTAVDTSEMPTNRGFSMYPSRHRQIAKDLAYLEDRNPWQIIDDALEEYVVKHYGKDYRRK